MSAVLRRALAGATLIAILVCGPLLVAAGWGQLSQVADALNRPEDGTLLVALLTGVGGLAWLVFLAAVVAEGIALVWGKPTRLPLPRVFRRVAAGLLGAVLGLAVNPALSTAAATPVSGSALTGAAVVSEPVPRNSPAPVPPLSVGPMLAAALIGALQARRWLRLRDRPPGRRLIPLDEPAARLRSAIGARQRPDRLAVLDGSMRAIGKHFYDAGLALPRLNRITVSDSEIVFTWGQKVSPPPPFGGDETAWVASVNQSWPACDHPCPFPAVVSLGSNEHGEQVLDDLEGARVLGVAADSAELRRASLAAMAVELACAPWSAETRLIAQGPDADLVAAAGPERVRVVSDLAEVLAEVRVLVEQRRGAMSEQVLAELRVDPDRAAAVAPVVYCLSGEVPAAVVTELDELLDGIPCAVVVMVGVAPGMPAQWIVGGDPNAPTGQLAGIPGSLAANSIPHQTRIRVGALIRSVDDPATEAAPWWSGTPGNVLPLTRGVEHPVNVVQILPVAQHPYLQLIGPAQLFRAAGPEPTRSRQQLIEQAAWLLEYPGSTATQMTAGMAIAEGTRRSNLSRLRAWLGNAPDQTPYLPEAHSGRILLHPGVSSDWQQLKVLLAPGIDQVADSTLVTALEMIHGAPLADAAPGQWHWAEELRIEIASALRDVGLVLTERALSRGDISLARWAAARALVVAAEDEQLLCARIRTEHQAGAVAETERLVNQVTRQARVLGVDLLPETVVLCQQVIEGRARVRWA